MTFLRRVLAASAPAVLFSGIAFAQVEAPSFTNVPFTLDTGWVEADGPGAQHVLVDALTIQQPGADWMRIYFDDVVLGGDPLAGNGAELRVISVLDGGLQIMNSIEVERWRQSTAYFNGDTVIIEVWAIPGTGSSRVSTKAIDMGIPPVSSPDRSICGTFDDRLPSSDPRSGRLLPIGCTGWLIQDCAGCALTAGHCTGNISVLQFNVPPSNGNGSINNPPPSDQYPIDASSVQTNGGQGVGNDYAYFGLFPNGTTGMTATQVQGPGFQLANPPGVGTANIRITGFGTDSDNPTRNQVQQTHVGALVTSAGTTVQYTADTTGGNSGSPVIWEQTGLAVGIHTHGGCSSSGGQNSGTSHAHPGLQGYLANPQGVCGGGVTVSNPPTLIPRGSVAQVAAVTNGPIVAGSVTLHHRPSSSGMFQSTVMTDMGGGNWTADLPAYDCGDQPEFYVSAQSQICGQVFAPMGGPSTPFTASIGTTANLFADDFQTDQGWTTQVQGATTGQWQRGVPVNDGGWAYDPASDGDGSGSCYLTQNTAGNSDVDNGSVLLTSPSTTISSSSAQVSYLYYTSMTVQGPPDGLFVEVSVNGGAWQLVNTHDTSTAPGWQSATISSADLAAAGFTAGSSIRTRFTASDFNAQSIMEAGVDGYSVDAVSCNPSAVGTVYCDPAVQNSSGSPATLRGMGSAVLASNDLTLIAESLPTSTVGYFLVSRTQGLIMSPGGSAGNLCLAGDIGRYAGNVLNSGAGGAYQMTVDWSSIPQPNGAVSALVGETWNFQSWFRDFVLVPTSNFTSGLSVTVQ